MHVVATAGHVDHGKSTLVTALTGTDPDRLAEEKARGLTIDLGFASTGLPSGRGVAFSIRKAANEIVVQRLLDFVVQERHGSHAVPGTSHETR